MYVHMHAAIVGGSIICMNVHALCTCAPAGEHVCMYIYIRMHDQLRVECITSLYSTVHVCVDHDHCPDLSLTLIIRFSIYIHT